MENANASDQRAPQHGADDRGPDVRLKPALPFKQETAKNGSCRAGYQQSAVGEIGPFRSKVMSELRHLRMIRVADEQRRAPPKITIVMIGRLCQISRTTAYGIFPADGSLWAAPLRGDALYRGP